jgi:hypothetical protein
MLLTTWFRNSEKSRWFCRETGLMRTSAKHSHRKKAVQRRVHLQVEQLEERATPDSNGLTFGPSPESMFGVNQGALGNGQPLSPTFSFVPTAGEAGSFNNAGTNIPPVETVPFLTVVNSPLTVYFPPPPWMAELQRQRFDSARLRRDDDILPDRQQRDLLLTILQSEARQRERLTRLSDGNIFSSMGAFFMTGGARRGSLSGFVYGDANRNHHADDGEQGVAGVTVILRGTDLNGNLVERRTVTGSDGFYIFTDLPAGFYTVEAVGVGNHRSQRLSFTFQDVLSNIPSQQMNIPLGPVQNNGQQNQPDNSADNQQTRADLLPESSLLALAQQIQQAAEHDHDSDDWSTVEFQVGWSAMGQDNSGLAVALLAATEWAWDVPAPPVEVAITKA